MVSMAGKRRFSAAQKAAQRLFAKRAKSGSMKKRRAVKRKSASKRGGVVFSLPSLRGVSSDPQTRSAYVSGHLDGSRNAARVLRRKGIKARVNQKSYFRSR